MYDFSDYKTFKELFRDFIKKNDNMWERRKTR